MVRTSRESACRAALYAGRGRGKKGLSAAGGRGASVREHTRVAHKRFALAREKKYSFCTQAGGEGGMSRVFTPPKVVVLPTRLVPSRPQQAGADARATDECVPDVVSTTIPCNSDDAWLFFCPQNIHPTVPNKTSIRLSQAVHSLYIHIYICWARERRGGWRERGRACIPYLQPAVARVRSQRRADLGHHGLALDRGVVFAVHL